MQPAMIATAYALPYEAAIHSSPLLSGGDMAILRVVPASPADEAATADYASVVTAFGVLASTGAFAGTVGRPAAAANFKWSDPRLAASGLEWELVGGTFDERAAIVLAQMFLLSHPNHPIQAVTLALPGKAVVPLPYDPRLEDPYPPIWQPAPFPVMIDPDFFETATLHVQLARPPTPDEQGEIEGHILAWAAATAMGAYGIAPVPPDECSAQFDPSVSCIGGELEFDIVRMRAHRAALHGLVNACIALHQTVVPITDLRIE